MDTNYQSCNPEVWGGLECTINRIKDTFRDQLKYAGHYHRTRDIDHIAATGIRMLRYPILWEAHQRGNEEQKINWSQTSQQLQRIRSNHIIPIAGLVHHGSGPGFTSLLDDHFAEKLAAYALKVAMQFPWIEYYTPVNEPLTTARFSGLYGCWYPHFKDEFSFFKMLLNQLKAIVLSMKAIRTVNPDAKLIQTEDLAKVHSTPLLKYQADFENERRWLTYDFLYGKVDDTHPLWDYFIDNGIQEKDLQFFLENPCMPYVAGFNYYVTSERYLDEKIHLYPETSRGGNGNHSYSDLAAVRAIKPSGLKRLLREAWERYQSPMALTEVHMNCTREEQLRWFKEAWDHCVALKKQGVKIKAITAWSLLGAYDWDSLLTREQGNYESGVFDISKNGLRPTAIARLVSDLAKKGHFHHPVMSEKGWWHKSYPQSRNNSSNLKGRPLLILGAGGTLGTAFVKICALRSLSYHASKHDEVDITDIDQIENAINQHKPWAVINAAGYVRVDDAETEQEACFKLNTEGPENLARICKQHGIQLMTFSSDLVFNGEKQTPYIEPDSVKPLNIYGQSKARSESLVMNNFSSSLIIRTSSFFGPWDHYNFALYILNSLKENRTCTAVNDVTISPTYVPDLVNRSLDLLIDEEKGIWHLTNDGILTWSEFAEIIALRGGYKKKNIVSRCQHELTWKAKRPAYSVLQSGKGIKLPSLDHAMNRFFKEKIT